MTETCLGIKNSGEPCARQNVEDNGYCFQHQGQAPGGFCGHVNAHFNDIECTLDNDHVGDHSAFYTLDGEPIQTWWGDMAGTPVDEIEPELE